MYLPKKRVPTKGAINNFYCQIKFDSTYNVLQFVAKKEVKMLTTTNYSKSCKSLNKHREVDQLGFPVRTLTQDLVKYP